MLQLCALLSMPLVIAAVLQEQQDTQQVVRGNEASQTQPALCTVAYRVLGMKRTKSGAL